MAVRPSRSRRAGNYPFGITVDYHECLWTDSGNGALVGGVMSKPLDGGPSTALVPGGSPGPVVVDGTGLYWLNRIGSVMELPLDGGTPVICLGKEPCQSGRGLDQCLLADGSGLYASPGGPRQTEVSSGRRGETRCRLPPALLVCHRWCGTEDGNRSHCAGGGRRLEWNGECHRALLRLPRRGPRLQPEAPSWAKLHAIRVARASGTVDTNLRYPPPRFSSVHCRSLMSDRFRR